MSRLLAQANMLLKLKEKFPDLLITGSVAWGVSDPNDLDVAVRSTIAWPHVNHPIFSDLGFRIVPGPAVDKYTDPSVLAVYLHSLSMVHVQVIHPDFWYAKLRTQHKLLEMFPLDLWNRIPKAVKSDLWRVFIQAFRHEAWRC
jgi:hypothetical protein